MYSYDVVIPRARTNGVDIKFVTAVVYITCIAIGVRLACDRASKQL